MRGPMLMLRSSGYHFCHAQYGATRMAWTRSFLIFLKILHTSGIGGNVYRRPDLPNASPSDIRLRNSSMQKC